MERVRPFVSVHDLFSFAVLICLVRPSSLSGCNRNRLAPYRIFRVTPLRSPKPKPLLPRQTLANAFTAHMPQKGPPTSA